MLTEDFLRGTEGYENSEAFGVITYLPYHEDGHETRIIRLAAGKEIILYKSGFSSQSKLRKKSIPSDYYDQIPDLNVRYSETTEHHRLLGLRSIILIYNQALILIPSKR